MEKIIKNCIREQFLKKTNQEYELLKKDPKAYADYLQEI